ncbi:MAG: alpha-2-macroglobulin family protein [Pirellulales bacterium]
MFRTVSSPFNRLKLLGLFSLACVIPTLVLSTPTGFEPRQAAAIDEPKKAGSTTEDELLSNLGGVDRHQTFISTDKPIYRIGEQVYVRAVRLHHSTHKPMADGMGGIPLFQITGPKGNVVAQGYAEVKESVAGFSWTVPDGQAGGEYTIKVTHPFDGYAPAERKFDIRAYRAPRLKTQIKFLRDGYGPGDEVVAMLDVSRAEGGFPTGAKVTAVGLVDGVEVAKSSLSVDSSGKSLARFSLPEKMRRGEGTIAMTIEDGGVVETASKTIPILLQTVDLQLYPEGGDLIAGLNCRVYLEAKTPARKPADIAGVILNRAGVQVAEFKTEHEGRGRFSVTPKLGEAYTLKITQPSGIATTFKLPEVKAQGATLRSLKETYAKGEPIPIEVRTTLDAGYVTLSKRERVLQRIDVEKKSTGNSQVLSFDKIDSSADGVLIATIWKDAQTPIAERLVFREPSKAVRIEIQPEKSKLTPGGKTKVKVITTDENGKPLSALVGLTVTDESVLEMIDKREQAPQLPVQVLLESDVQELADAHVYLNPLEPKAALATDLLLGTQGWRRFAVIKPTEFLANHGEIGRRVLAHLLPPLRSGGMDGFADPGLPGGFGGGRVERFKLKQNDKLAEGALPQREAPAPLDMLADNKVVADAKKDQAPAIPAGDRANAVVAEGALAKRMPVVGGLGGGGLGGRGRGASASEIRASFTTVRVYAHEVSPNRPVNQRTDFAETLFWSAGLRTDDKGEASFEFALNDSITSFQIAADGLSANGGLGASRTSIQSVVPFYIESKLPMEVTAGDIVDLPIAAINATEQRINNLNWTINAGDNKVQVGSSSFEIDADSRIRHVAKIEIGSKLGEQVLEVTAATQAAQPKSNIDTVSDSQKKLRCSSAWFPSGAGPWRHDRSRRNGQT